MASSRDKLSASSKAKMKYNEKAYDRLAIIVPKGEKEIIQSQAKLQNESLNGYVTKAITQRMEREKSAETENIP